MSIEDIDKDCDFVMKQDATSEIMVIGVGGGGNNAINNMFKSQVENVDFIVCNTDRQALKNSPIQRKLLLGPTVTKGLGAGNVPSVARLAAEESASEIEDLFDERTKMVFVTAGMGGGTGTGAAPIVAKMAKERGLLTVGVVTIPFLFEGNTKILKALDGVEEMSKYVDALLVVNNQRLCDIYKDLDFLNAFGKADDTLTTAVRSISDLITIEGYINLDLNDVDTTLRNGGPAIISSGYGEGEKRVTKAFEEALNSPLLKNRNVMTSKKLLFNIYFSSKAENKYSMHETAEITSFVSNINPGVDIIWGATIDDSLGEQVKITILAAGFDVEFKEEENNNVNFIEPAIVSTSTVISEDPDRIKEVYGHDTIEDLHKQRYILLNRESMDDDSIIETIESNPTFNREKNIAADLRSRIKALAEGVDVAPAAKPHNNENATNQEGQVVSFMG